MQTIRDGTQRIGGSMPAWGGVLTEKDIEAVMVAGVDVWLNTPLRPFEASGTSGMKAAFNGVPNLSVLDSW